MLRRLYNRVLQLAASPRAPLWLGIVAFAESSFFPVPPDALLIPMALALPGRAWRYAALCTVCSIMGGMLGYEIGYALYEQVAQPLLQLYHYEDAFATFREQFVKYAWSIILIKGLTPIPYKIVTIAAGAAHIDFATFVVASIITRGARFFLIATLLRFYGESVRDFIERRLAFVLGAGAVAAVGGFVALKYV